MMLKSAVSVLTAGLVGAAFMTTALAQQVPQSYGIAAVVNDDIVTEHDVRQRVLFILATTGAEQSEDSLRRINAQAVRNLIDEKIQLQESDKYEQKISREEVDRSVGRLIGRNGLDPQDVVQRLAQVGISINTLRDQVEAEIAWQRIVNGLYGSRIRISDAQIDETLNRLTANASKPSFRIAEIYIEGSDDIGGMDGALEGANAMITQVKQGAPFPLLAQQFSSAPSAAAGGDLGWVREGELRPELDAVMMTLEEGGISDPIKVPGGYYVIVLLGKQVSETETFYKMKQINVSVDPNTDLSAAKAKLEEARAAATSCDTLDDDIKPFEGVNQADMGELKSADINEELLGKIAAVNPGGLTEIIETPSSVAAIMVCERRVGGSGIPTRDEVEDRLVDQQLAQASKRHLRDLRRKAAIQVRQN